VRVVIQRVREASVRVDGDVVGQIDGGLLVLLGIAPEDGPKESLWMAKKLAGMRIFADDEGRMNRSVVETGQGALVVSQFTLYGNCRKGRRPSFVHAAHPDHAEPAYEQFCLDLAAAGVTPVSRGVFGANMDVQLINDGPVTLILDSP